MTRKAFLLIAVFLMAVFAYSQTDTVRIAGRVIDTEGMPVEACIVAVLQPTDSSIVAYSMTSEDGRYATEFVSHTNEVLMRLTGFNVKKTIRRVGAKSQTLDFLAEDESITLREVQVKAQKLWGSRDTLNYLVSAYMKDQDRTIGDVLKQLPGITIEGGTIKYQGTPINHFYIENMDVLQGRYSIATEGIRAEDVATVQVLENHEHVKALQDQVPPESAAINLKLKEKAKGVWTRSASVGLGIEEASGVLYDTDINMMYFGKRRQHVFFYGNENTGATSDIAMQHYGGGGLGATVLTSILSPGNSPVGTILRNNRHSLNSSNLTKLSETAQLHYNVTYKHDIQRRSEYSQTTYILPDGDVRIMAEDISARHTMNDASVELTYEDNGERRFLSNKLEMVGSWDEGKGETTSPQPSPQGEGAEMSPSIGAVIYKSNNQAPSLVGRVGERSYLRNLGLQNSTRWVHRTENGGGFELISTNSVQTTPQSLTVSGDMDARQEVDMTRIRSLNDFSLVKNLRRHRWTIVPTGSLNINYVNVNPLLTLTNATEAGTMDYLKIDANAGATLRYVKNELRLTLRLPLSLAHTIVQYSPTSVPFSPITSASPNATHLRLSPSFNVLWKASDNWTLSGDAAYGASQTPWTQLITTYIMSNYRTMSRYVASLNDSHTASASAKLNYKNILNEFFAYIQGGYSRSWSGIALGTTIDENAYTIVQAVRMPHHSDGYNLIANASKGFDWHAAKIEATARWLRNDSETLRQGVRTAYRNNTYNINGSIAADVVKHVRIGYNCDWTKTVTSSPSLPGRTGVGLLKTFNQNARLDVSIVPTRLLLKIAACHTHNSGYSGKKDYAFADASLTLKTKKKQEFVLSVDNIFNTHTFVSRSNSDLTESLTMYDLRPRSVMLKTHLNL